MLLKTCPHRIQGCCTIAERFLERSGQIRLKVSCADDAFKACSNCKCPHTVNYVSASLAFSTASKVTELPPELRGALLLAIRSRNECDRSGPGTSVSKLLKYLRIKPDEECDCDIFALWMDYKGTTWCKENLTTVVGWLREGAEKRNWPFSEAAAELLVRLSIELSEGADWVLIIKKLPELLRSD